MDRKDRIGPDSTEKIKVYPDSDYTIEDYYSDFEGSSAPWVGKNSLVSLK